MTVAELIKKLSKYNPNLPVCINDYIGFIEITEKTIDVEKKKYITFPFTSHDEFEYINLRGKKYED